MRVLLVEDDEADALLVGYALEEMASLTPQLTHAQNAGEAEKQLRRGGFDVVLLDMGLPDAQGLDGLSRLQKCAPDVPIILLTGFNDEERALQALQSGAEDYLVKGKTDAPLLERSMRYAVERKRNENALLDLVREQVARREAESANRAKDEFLATLSHELRTPLNAILGWSSLLRSGELDEEAMQQAFETIERNARVQTRLIEDLLDVSRIITGHFQLQTTAVELADTIEITADMLRLNAQEKPVEVRLQLDKSVVVEGDPTRLQQIVWNLLSNAIKFTPPNGRVEITLRRAPFIEYSNGVNDGDSDDKTNIEYSNEIAAHEIAAHVVSRNDAFGNEEAFAVLTVRDSGQGIAPDFLPYVFERFRQADGSTTRRHSGLGLGLSITRNLVELHGGHISAHSEGLGHGAIFTVVLPLSTPTDDAV